MSDDVYYEQIDEVSGAGRLGRHIQHDPRSRAYEFDTGGITVTDVRHARNVPIFDQGDLGSCTGNAAVGCIATDPIFQTLPLHPNLDEDEAVKVYSLATTLDDDPDNYPPVDTGSTGLAAAKALTQLGFTVGYQHTFSFTAALKALVTTPTMYGINWYDSFDQPDGNGLVSISKDAQVRGGHEIYADEIITSKQLIGFTNSWNTSWGLLGRFYMSYDTVERLLHEKGDVTVPIAASSPVTGPTGPSGPVTGPTGPSGTTGPAVNPTGPLTPDDVALYAAIQTWARSKGLS